METVESGKRGRTFLACDSCRRSKLRCITSDDGAGSLELSTSLQRPKCQRCERLDIDCQYTPKRSQLKKRLKIPMDTSVVTESDSFTNAVHNLNHQYRKKPHLLDPIILPNKQVLVQIISQFFENQYHSMFSFINKKLYIEWISSAKFEVEFFNYDDPSNVPVFSPCTLLAILALLARHNDELCQMYGTFDCKNDPQRYIPDFQQTQNPSPCPQSSRNASRYFAYYARQLLKDEFDTPSVQRIQTLTLLASHEWSEGSYVRSYLYVGIAARMCSILGLCSSTGACYQNQSFVTNETNRRTVWSVYMMDRCTSSGKNRNHALEIEDIEVPLPCPEENFQDDVEIEFHSYDECFEHFNELTSLDLTIIAFELWSNVAKWVGDNEVKTLKLNDSNSKFGKIYSNLELLRDKLSVKVESEFPMGNLNFGFFCQLLYLCEVFLTRELFFYNSTISQLDFLKFTERLRSVLKSSTELNDRLLNQDSFIFTPFTFFQIFTNCVSCLSISSILQDDELASLSLKNMEFLSIHSTKDQSIEKWFKICQQLKDYLSVTNNSNLNTDKFKNLLNDFTETEVQEKVNTIEPQKHKKLDLHDILNSTFTPTSTTNADRSLYQSSIETDSNNNNYVEIDKYFKNWQKIIPNWNDVFTEFEENTLNV